jgi:uncharacterized protein (TIGR00251 family)
MSVRHSGKVIFKMHGRKATMRQTAEPAFRLPAFITAQSDGLLLAIRLQPRASKNEIGEPIGNELRIRVTAPPVDSAANRSLISLLAGIFDCPPNKLELIRGHTSRHKTVRVCGLSAQRVLEAIAQK